MKRVEEADLQHILNHTTNLWPEIKDSTILITGGTGFFGKWLLESFLYVNTKLSLHTTLYVLSRDPGTFLSAYPQFNFPAIHFIKGDIKEFKFPDVTLDYIIHAATEANVTLNVNSPFIMYDTILEGTRNILELAKIKNVKAVLHTSSGAMYGAQPPGITHIEENYKGAPDVYAESAAYGEGKRVAEMMANLYFIKYGVKSKIARCFAFVGPYLPLDAHFAVGNFIKSVINNEQIQIKGDGSPYRSYLYATDLVIWLWTILIKGEVCRPYNVGSDEEITIAGLAKRVAQLNGGSINTLQKNVAGLPPQRYVPSITRAKNELDLKVLIQLNSALDKTYKFYNSI